MQCFKDLVDMDVYHNSANRNPMVDHEDLICLWWWLRCTPAHIGALPKAALHNDSSGDEAAAPVEAPVEIEEGGSTYLRQCMGGFTSKHVSMDNSYGCIRIGVRNYLTHTLATVCNHSLTTTM